MVFVTAPLFLLLILFVRVIEFGLPALDRAVPRLRSLKQGARLQRQGAQRTPRIARI
jgi:hypothetical protein